MGKVVKLNCTVKVVYQGGIGYANYFKIHTVSTFRQASQIQFFERADCRYQRNFRRILDQIVHCQLTRWNLLYSALPLPSCFHYSS